MTTEITYAELQIDLGKVYEETEDEYLLSIAFLTQCVNDADTKTTLETGISDKSDERELVVREGAKCYFFDRWIAQQHMNSEINHWQKFYIMCSQLKKLKQTNITEAHNPYHWYGF